jgi:hypothetical protein
MAASISSRVTPVDLGLLAIDFSDVGHPLVDKALRMSPAVP